MDHNTKYVIYMYKYESKGDVNLGDNIQHYVLSTIYERIGIAKKNITYMSKENVIKKARSENYHYIFPLVAVTSCYYDVIKMVFDAGLQNRFTFIPLAIGYSRYNFMTQQNMDKFRYLTDLFEGPIGCRDHDTAYMYEKEGYSVYVNGCITNTLPKREPNDEQRLIYAIDIPQKLWDYMPEEISKNAVKLSQISEDGISADALYDQAVKRIVSLKDTASLVITRRYHVAVPCHAIGIPVIMVEDSDELTHWEFDLRLSALDPDIPYYTEEQFGEINWNTVWHGSDDIKNTMLDLIEARLKGDNSCRQAKQLEAMYAPSKERFYGIFCKRRDNIFFSMLSFYLDERFLRKISDGFKYYFYGISNSGKSFILKRFMEKYYPEAVFLGYVDRSRIGFYDGKEITALDNMNIEENTYCINTAWSANEWIKNYFSDNGLDLSHLWEMPRPILFWYYHGNIDEEDIK